MLRSTLIVTLFTVAGQAVSFLVLVVAAALFGASVHMDAYLAAITLPQYVTSVVLGAFGAVFIPVFVQYRAKGQEEDAWRVASAVISLWLFCLTAVALIGMLFAEPLIRLSTPGLAITARVQAAHAAIAAWPMIVPTGVYSLLSGIYQADGRFGWPAAAPVLGGLVTIGVLALVVPSFGVIGLAASMTIGAVVQAALLMPVLGGGRFRFTLNWRHQGVREVFELVTPLVLSGLVVRWTPVVERFLASSLPAGSIAKLGYAFTLTTVLSRLLATGISTVIYPQMASDAVASQPFALAQRIGQGLRTMWLGVAPAITIGIALAPSVIAVAFRRGQFGADDVAAITPILRIYLVGLLGMCLGTITGRGFYVIRDTKTLARFGILEALAYGVYTAALAAAFGLKGIAWGYVLYFTGSLSWHIMLLARRTTALISRDFVLAVARTTIAAIVAGMSAWAVAEMLSSAIGALSVGGIVGLIVYVLTLRWLGCDELALIEAPVLSWLQRTRMSG